MLTLPHPTLTCLIHGLMLSHEVKDLDKRARKPPSKRKGDQMNGERISLGEIIMQVALHLSLWKSIKAM